MTAALYSNPNYDGEENGPKRDQIIQRLEEQFAEKAAALYNSEIGAQEREADEAYENNPFFQKSREGLREQGVPELEEFLEEDNG